jgi:hypothetical protein
MVEQKSGWTLPVDFPLSEEEDLWAGRIDTMIFQLLLIRGAPGTGPLPDRYNPRMTKSSRAILGRMYALAVARTGCARASCSSGLRTAPMHTPARLCENPKNEAEQRKRALCARCMRGHARRTSFVLARSARFCLRLMCPSIMVCAQRRSGTWRVRFRPRSTDGCLRENARRE